MTRRRIALAALVIATAAGAACRPRRPDPPVAPAAVGGDTLRGTFVLEGNDPMPAAVLRTANGRVVLDAAPPAMRALVQLDLRVQGTAEGAGRFRVESFLVRAAGGHAAWDGTLQREDDGFALRLADGSLHLLRAAPDAFGGLVGRRLWITETAAQTVSSYGVIE